MIHNELNAARIKQLEEEVKQLKHTLTRDNNHRNSTSLPTVPSRPSPHGRIAGESFPNGNVRGRNSRRDMVRYSLDDEHAFEFRAYCGTECGQSGYWNSCGNCDGFCGPNNGCQCVSCHELDEEVRRRQEVLGSLVNRNRAQAHVSFNTSRGHEEDYHFYCGKRVGQAGYYSPCGYCDGICGPTNGCQCVDCHGLDRHYQLLKPV